MAMNYFSVNEPIAAFMEKGKLISDQHVGQGGSATFAKDGSVQHKLPPKSHMKGRRAWVTETLCCTNLESESLKLDSKED